MPGLCVGKEMGSGNGTVSEGSSGNNSGAALWIDGPLSFLVVVVGKTRRAAEIISVLDLHSSSSAIKMKGARHKCRTRSTAQ